MSFVKRELPSAENAYDYFSSFPIRFETERVNPPRFNSDQRPTIADALESTEDKMIRMMEKVLEGQQTILTRIDRLEERMTVAEMESKMSSVSGISVHLDQLKATQYQHVQQMIKINTELSKIGHRTGCIKDLVVNTAAITLNTSRKIHGAKSVLDPVQHFKDGGYKDWSIRPVPATPQIPSNAPAMFGNPFAHYQHKEHEHTYNVLQQGNRTPAYGATNDHKWNMPQSGNRATPYGSRTHVYGASPQANNSTPYGRKPPVYESSSNYGNRTPVYDGSRTPVYDQSEFEGFENSFEKNHTKSHSAAKGSESPYRPSSPNFNE